MTLLQNRPTSGAFRVTPLWETSGTVQIPENASPAEAFKAAGADFKVTTAQLQLSDGTPSPLGKACVRCDGHPDPILGHVGNAWVPVQNEAMIELFYSLDGLVQLDNILVIGNGQKVFASAQLSEGKEIADGHIIRRYLHVFNDHSGRGSYGINFSDVNLVCANQLNYVSGKHANSMIGKGYGLRHSHTRGVVEFAANLGRMIDFQNQRFHQSVEELEAMKSQALEPSFTRAVLENLYRKELTVPVKTTEDGEKIERKRTLDDIKAAGNIARYLDDGYGMDSPGVRGTRYGLFQAITQSLTHDNFADRESRDNGMNVEQSRRRLESLWSGGVNATRINEARQLCLA